MLPFFDPGQFKEWVYQNAIAIDQLVNTIFNGSADETISSRCYRLNHRYPYKVLEKIVDALSYPFQGANHCRNAYQKELDGRHRPVNMDSRKTD